MLDSQIFKQAETRAHRGAVYLKREYANQQHKRIKTNPSLKGNCNIQYDFTFSNIQWYDGITF